nr:DUF2231 domain-containing protein [Paraburkholderia fungorum]
MAKKGDSASSSTSQPKSEVLLELLRLDAGSAVAFVGHPIHVMMVHFPIAFVVATLGVDVIYWWSGDPFWIRAGLWAAGSPSGAAWARASSAPPSFCWCAASGSGRPAGRTPSPR